MISQRQDKILACLRERQNWSREELGGRLEQLGLACSKVTLLRDLNELASSGLIEKSGTGRATRYGFSLRSAITRSFDINEYFSIESDRRVLRSETFSFAVFHELHSLLTPEERADADKLNEKYLKSRESLTPRLLQKTFERLTIELSWKSSRLEGNTYDLLETEQLLRNNVEAQGRTAEEARMLLNHKNALEFIEEEPKYYQELSVAKIVELHSMLTRGLHIASGLRTGLVGIIGTVYRPLDNCFQIQDAMEQLVSLLNRTKHPVEKALTAVLLVSYLQPFEDGNKRTGRILGNALLLAGGYCPLSYRSVDEAAYKKAVILFYEQNSIAAFKQLFLEQFRMAVKTYF